jgi:hypothetical protein
MLFEFDYIAIFIYFVDFLTPRVKKHVVIMLLFLLDYCSCYVHLNMIFFNGIFFPGVVQHILTFLILIVGYLETIPTHCSFRGRFT